MSGIGIGNKLTLPHGQTSIDANGITVEGTYCSYINGYLHSQEGKCFIEWQKLLTVRRTSGRSKKMMFSFVLLGSIIPLILSGIQKLGNALFKTTDLTKIAEKGSKAISFIGANPSILEYSFTALVLIVIAAYILLIAYFFSKRKYIELVYIGGVIRFRCDGISRGQIDDFVRMAYQAKKRNCI